MILFISEHTGEMSICAFTDVVLCRGYMFSRLICYEDDKTLLLIIYNCILSYNPDLFVDTTDFIKWQKNIMSRSLSHNNIIAS